MKYKFSTPDNIKISISVDFKKTNPKNFCGVIRKIGGADVLIDIINKFRTKEEFENFLCHGRYSDDVTKHLYRCIIENGLFYKFRKLGFPVEDEKLLASFIGKFQRREEFQKFLDHGPYSHKIVRIIHDCLSKQEFFDELKKEENFSEDANPFIKLISISETKEDFRLLLNRGPYPKKIIDFIYRRATEKAQILFGHSYFDFKKLGVPIKNERRILNMIDSFRKKDDFATFLANGPHPKKITAHLRKCAIEQELFNHFYYDFINLGFPVEDEQLHINMIDSLSTQEEFMTFLEYGPYSKRVMEYVLRTISFEHHSSYEKPLVAFFLDDPGLWFETLQPKDAVLHDIMKYDSINVMQFLLGRKYFNLKKDWFSIFPPSDEMGDLFRREGFRYFKSTWAKQIGKFYRAVYSQNLKVLRKFPEKDLLFLWNHFRSPRMMSHVEKHPELLRLRELALGE